MIETVYFISAGAAPVAAPVAAAVAVDGAAVAGHAVVGRVEGEVAVK